jgi:hypothetical protein
MDIDFAVWKAWKLLVANGTQANINTHITRMLIRALSTRNLLKLTITYAANSKVSSIGILKGDKKGKKLSWNLTYSKP